MACHFLHLTNVTTCRDTTSVSVSAAVVVGAAGRHHQPTTTTTTIPTEIGLLTQLTSLSLSRNRLTGTIPSTLGNLVQLTTLWLHTNQLIGTIPSALGNLTLLSHLFLDGNARLAGTIPSTLCSNSGIEIYVDCRTQNVECSCCRSLNGAACPSRSTGMLVVRRLEKNRDSQICSTAPASNKIKTKHLNRRQFGVELVHICLKACF